ncbi:iron-hydroxamate ABC transporter substrate-binding protein [Paenibacillus sp. HN-1]|uniref:iron-hydroxamate ABC transporter substrate-binding protein n=1 Tax=Paenibacillus TaxID=44249 RepID=UPI001CA97D42|nr:MULTISPECIES: iron-hydroxamate ABC transporter substrate-binding protein [Paenibacillus]MBY9078062.1 iron-hydroxamate ABC transporter substrate-binding protein [Paenibacillus sp. CGMCC 1.18879]MBY9083803.1 iron-hydroxamate ABC transporter substrate-binding protein [Paenibacillus sinensis]
MRKWLTPVLLLTLIILTACGNQAANNNTAAGTAAPSEAAKASAAASSSAPAASAPADGGTITYESQTGPIVVPANPQRIVALTNAPNVISLGGTLVGVDEWTGKNPLFTDKLSGVKVVSEDSLEDIIELKPDLIIAGDYMKNLDKLAQIAPTVVYTWGKLDYLNQQIEIGKLLNKQTEAQAWVDDFKTRAEAAGKEIKAKIGENATVSVFEYDAKSIYVFGNNWARGTEVLYQAMGLKMPEAVKKDALGPGYYTLSNETVPQYAGDYIVLSKPASNSENAFFSSDTWKNIPAVKNGHVIEIESEKSSYSDPTTLEYLLKVFTDGFLAK